MTEQRRFSHSLIDTMLDCPRKAAYRYVENIKSPRSAALIKGSACDEAWNKALDTYIADGERMPIADIVTLTEERYRAVVANDGGIRQIDWGDDKGDPKAAARKHLDASMRLTRVWAETLYPSIEPAAVQLEYTRTLPSGREFIGFVDWSGTWDNLPCIGDNKTASRAMPQGDADKALQPSAYSWLIEANSVGAETETGEFSGPDVNFVFARAIETSGGNRKGEFVATKRTWQDNNWYGHLVEEVEAQFVAGNFPPNPKSNLCGPKWCPYFERCMPHKTTHAGANAE